MSSRRSRRALAGVGLVALTLRLLPIGWGAGLRPYEGFYHPDEPKVFTSTAGFPGNYLSNPILLYGTAVQYSLGAALVPAKVLWASGLRPRPFEHYAHFVLLVERGVHVLLGALTVIVVHGLGLQLFGHRVAGIAALLLAVSPLHVLNSALATLDVPLAFLATLVVLLALRAFDSERRRDFVWLGVAMGALLGTKITAAVVLVAPLALLAGRPSARHLAAVAGGIALVVFSISTPSILVQTKDYLALMSSQHATWVADRPDDLLSVLTVQSAALRAGLGWPAALLSIAGLAMAVAGGGGQGPDRPAAHVAVLAVLLAHVLLWRGYAPLASPCFWCPSSASTRLFPSRSFSPIAPCCEGRVSPLSSSHLLRVRG